MLLIDRLAEQKIAAAIERGELDDLPGEGRPLALADDALVPEELRAAYRLLKNAGYLPPDVALRGEIRSVESLIVQARTQEERHRLSRRLRYLVLQLNITSPDAPMLAETYYLDKISRGS